MAGRELDADDGRQGDGGPQSWTAQVGFHGREHPGEDRGDGAVRPTKPEDDIRAGGERQSPDRRPERRETKHPKEDDGAGTRHQEPGQHGQAVAMRSTDQQPYPAEG